MTPRTVIDTNIWIRILLRGRTTLPILAAFNADQFQLVMSQPLFDEFHDVWPRISHEHVLRKAPSPGKT